MRKLLLLILCTLCMCVSVEATVSENNGSLIITGERLYSTVTEGNNDDLIDADTSYYPYPTISGYKYTISSGGSNGGGRRFYLYGMVHNSGAQCDLYKHTQDGKVYYSANAYTNRNLTDSYPYISIGFDPIIYIPYPTNGRDLEYYVIDFKKLGFTLDTSKTIVNEPIWIGNQQSQYEAFGDMYWYPNFPNVEKISWREVNRRTSESGFKRLYYNLFKSNYTINCAGRSYTWEGLHHSQPQLSMLFSNFRNLQFNSSTFNILSADPQVLLQPIINCIKSVPVGSYCSVGSIESLSFRGFQL